MLTAMAGARAHVIEATLSLGDACDPAAVGAAVTTELCGHWDHDGPCRWPHNSAIDSERDPALFRTLFIAEESDAAAVYGRVEAALRHASDWHVFTVRSRPVASSERVLAERLLAGPRQSG